MDKLSLPATIDTSALDGLVAISSLDLPTIKSAEFTDQYSLLIKAIDQLSELKKGVDSEIKRVMEEEYNETGDTNLISGNRKYSYVPPSTRVTIDSKKLQAEQPDVYAKYARVSNVSASIRSSIIEEEKKD